MKKTLLLMAAALMVSFCAYAQDVDEGGEDEVVPVVHTKVLTATLEDAKFIVADSHYTVGQSDLQAAIATAESQLETLASDAEVRDVVIELRHAIDHFVYFNDHVDATDRIQNPDFSKDATNATNITGWVSSGFKQDARDRAYPSTRVSEEGTEIVVSKCIEQWANQNSGTGVLAGSGNIYQTIFNLPAGHYRLTADCFVVRQKDANVEEAYGAYLYANDKSVELGMTDVLTGTNSVAFSIDVDLADGDSLTIGFRYADLNVNWLGWDNVTLLYVGDSEAYNSVVYAEKVAAAKEALEASLTAAREAVVDENMPLGRTDLQAAIDVAAGQLESDELDALELAKSELDARLKEFNDYNRHYINLQKAIAAAEELVASGELTNGTEEYLAAIEQAKADVELALQYADSPSEAIVPLQEALVELQEAEASYRAQNASYAHPANVITNGGMSSINGWDILLGGSANPALHINTSGNVTGFSKPFMECWVATSESSLGYYGQENYARQTVSTLPDGQPLPKGYYVLKAHVLATQQGDASVEVSGVTLKFQDQEVAVSTGNGVSKAYMLGFDKTEQGGELTFGLYIDAETTANWIAWDEVELQFVGDKDKYLEDYAAAVLGESLEKLKEAVAEANALMESVDPNGIDLTDTDLYSAVDEGQYIIDNPTDQDATKEYIEQILEEIEAGMKSFYTSGVSPKDGQWFDFSSFIKNAELDTVPTDEEWEVVSGTLPSTVAENILSIWFGTSSGLDLEQEYQQTITDLPNGRYVLDVQASIRLDMTYVVDNYTEEALPNNLTSFQAYANRDSVDVHPLLYEDEAQGLTLDGMLAMTNDYDYRHGNGTVSTMIRESGLFHNYVIFDLEEEDGGEVTIGLRLVLPRLNGQQLYIDCFHLAYYGNQNIDLDTLTGVAAPAVAETGLRQTGIYTLTGQRVQKAVKGLYIINGRKVVIK